MAVAISTSSWLVVHADVHARSLPNNTQRSNASPISGLPVATHFFHIEPHRDINPLDARPALPVPITPRLTQQQRQQAQAAHEAWRLTYLRIRCSQRSFTRSPEPASSAPSGGQKRHHSRMRHQYAQSRRVPGLWEPRPVFTEGLLTPRGDSPPNLAGPTGRGSVEASRHAGPTGDRLAPSMEGRAADNGYSGSGRRRGRGICLHFEQASTAPRSEG